MGKEETHMAARILVAVAVLALGAASPAAASGPVSPACYAEVSPRVVSSGTVGQSFTVTVENDTPLICHTWIQPSAELLDEVSVTLERTQVRRSSAER